MFDETDRVKELKSRLTAFMDAHIYPNEKTFQDRLGEGDSRRPQAYIATTGPESQATVSMSFSQWLLVRVGGFLT